MTARLVEVRRALLGGFLLIFSLGGSACSPPPAAPPKESASDAVETKDHPLKGEVRKVDATAKELVIHHEEIPGFMPAMTMPFRMSADTDFDDYRPGDLVEAKLRVQSKGGLTVDYQLVDLEVVKPALGEALVLESVSLPPRLRVAPRRLEPGEEVPDFTLIDQEGTTRKLSDLRGDVVVLTFIYTRCPLPTFCPAMDLRFMELSKAVKARSDLASKVRLVSLSFDPDHDTPEVLRKHASIRGAVPPLWTYATTSHEDLARIAPPLGLTFGPVKNEIVHNLCTAVIAPDGRLARLEVGSAANAWKTDDFLESIAEALAPSPPSAGAK